MISEQQIRDMRPRKELDWEAAKLMGINENLFNWVYEAGNHNYSTDMSSAIKLADEMALRGWTLELGHNLLEGMTNGYYAIFFNKFTGVNCEVKTKNPATAIVKSALIANLRGEDNP
jgi:hypothetical protein